MTDITNRTTNDWCINSMLRSVINRCRCLGILCSNRIYCNSYRNILRGNVRHRIMRCRNRKVSVDRQSRSQDHCFELAFICAVSRARGPWQIRISRTRSQDDSLFQQELLPRMIHPLLWSKLVSTTLTCILCIWGTMLYPVAHFLGSWTTFLLRIIALYIFLTRGSISTLAVRISRLW